MRLAPWSEWCRVPAWGLEQGAGLPGCSVVSTQAEVRLRCILPAPQGASLGSSQMTAHSLGRGKRRLTVRGDQSGEFLHRVSRTGRSGMQLGAQRCLLLHHRDPPGPRPIPATGTLGSAPQCAAECWVSRTRARLGQVDVEYPTNVGRMATLSGGRAAGRVPAGSGGGASAPAGWLCPELRTGK